MYSYYKSVFFLCGCIVLSIASTTKERLPFLWEQAPSSLSDYPLISNCSSVQSQCRLIDPWLDLDRLGLYKILINVTSPLMPFCSPPSNTENILFGLATHLSWKFQSNRLYSNGTQQISVDSWWGAANYYISVISFLAAVDASLIRQEPFRLVQRGNFCSSSLECRQQVPEAMTQWRLFIYVITSLFNSPSRLSCTTGVL